MKNWTDFCKMLETGVQEPCLRGRGHSLIF